MRMVITHISALEAMRICKASYINSRVRTKNPQGVTSSPPIFTSTELKEHPVLHRLSKPLSVLNNSSSHRQNTLDASYRIWNLEQSSLIDLGGGLYIPDPETVFIQAALSLSPLQLICFGFELCGTYEIIDRTTSAPIDKMKPLSSAQKLGTAAQAAKNMRGAPAARKALPFIADRSASHMETATFLRLTLPYHMGGFNLPKPLMNHRVQLDKRKQAGSSEGYFVCDMIWPEQRLVVEYDSDLHANPLKIGRDASRKNALLDLGFEVITITKMQMFNMEEFNRSARAVGRKLNVRHQPRCADYEKRQADLVRQLLAR